MTDLFNYSRREASEVNIGATPMGGANPIRIQSMTNTITMDTDACIEQAKRLIAAGGTYQSGQLCRPGTHFQEVGIHR